MLQEIKGPLNYSTISITVARLLLHLRKPDIAMKLLFDPVCVPSFCSKIILNINIFFIVHRVTKSLIKGHESWVYWCTCFLSKTGWVTLFASSTTMWSICRTKQSWILYRSANTLKCFMNMRFVETHLTWRRFHWTVKCS